jgi:hypothetical protein
MKEEEGPPILRIMGISLIGANPTNSLLRFVYIIMGNDGRGGINERGGSILE